jgi:hypothetical protein
MYAVAQPKGVFPQPSLSFIMIFALVVRLAAVLPLHADGYYMSDERQYVNMAHRILDGQGFVSDNGELSTIAPLYIFLLAGIFKFVGSSLAIGHVLGCLLGVCIVVLGYLLCLELFCSERAALLSAAAVAFYPSLVIYAGLLVTETLYMVFFLCVILLAYKMVGRITMGMGVLLGIVSALATLTRAVFFGFFPVLLCMIWWMRRRENKHGIKNLILALVVWCVVLAPWSVRNYNLHHTFVPVSTGGGKVLLIGNNPFAPKSWHTEGFEEWLQQQAAARGVQNLSTLSEVELFSLYKEIAISFIGSHPFATVLLAIQKAYIFWIYPVANSDSNILEQAFVTIGDFLLYVGAAIGLGACWHYRTRLLLPFVAIGFFLAVQIVFHAEARFRLPVVPFLCMLFGYAAMMLTDRQRRTEFMSQKRNTRGSVVAIACIICVYVYTGVLFLAGKV